MISNPFIFCTFHSFNQIACWKQGSTDQNQIAWEQAVWYGSRTGPDQDQQTFENLGPIRTGRSVDPWLVEQATIIETNLICYRYNSLSDQQGYMPTEINS